MTRRSLSHILLLTVFAAPSFGFAQAQKAPRPRENQGVQTKPEATAPGSTKSGQQSPGAQSAGLPKTYKQVPIPPLPGFHPQQPKRIQLDNGVVVFLQEDHELPVIDGSVTIRGGGTEVPADKTGMMSIYGQVWRLGGTEKLTGDQMDEFLESRAARVSTSGGMEQTSLSWSCLKADFNEVFNLAIDLLQHPAFREDKITLSKTQLRSAISRRNDDIGSIVSREMNKIAYGPDNPYGREMEYDTVAAVTRADLVDFHKKHLSPKNMIVGVTGDFDAAQMEATLRKAFGALPDAPPDTLPKIAFNPPKPGVYFAEKEDVNQSDIRMFHLGIQKNNPDLFALDVMDQAYFSGGFSSRMMNEIRTKRGLAYSAGGAITAPYDHPGLLILSAGTKSQSTVETAQAIREMLATLNKEPATEAELKLAKDAILNSFIFTVDSKDKVLGERMTYEFYNYPADFLERYRAGIDKVTLADIPRVAQKYIHPEQLATLVVGRSAEFDKPLTTLGQVTKLDISIPPPGSLNKSAAGAGEAGAAPKPAANTPEAKALLAKVVQAVGGKEKLQQVKAVKRIAEATQKTPQGDMQITVDQTVVFPDRVHIAMQTPMGALTQVFAPSGSFMAMGPNLRDMPSSAAQEAAKQIHRDFVYVAQHADDPATQVSTGGTEKIGDVDGQVLEIHSGDTDVKWVVDPKTGLILRTAAQTMSQQGPAETITEYSNWKDVDGIKFPFSQKQTQNGEQVSSSEVKSIQVNPTVDAKLFEKPAAPKQ